MDISENPYNFEDRLSGFQQLIAPESLKKKQETYAIELRKKIRSDNTTKRRAVSSGFSFLFHQSEKENITIKNVPFALVRLSPELASLQLKPIDKLKMIHELLKEDTDTQVLIEGLQVSVEVLSTDEDTPYGTFILMDYIPIFQRLMDYKYCTSIVLSATICLANLCNAPHEYAVHVYRAGGFQSFLKVISPRNVQCTVMAITGIANLVGDCYDFRSAIIRSNLIDIISQFLEQVRENNYDLMSAISHLAVNLCEDSDEMELEQLDKIMQWMGKIIIFQELEIKLDCLRALRKISLCDDNRKIDLVFDNNLGGFCIQGLLINDSNCLNEALRIIANFLSLESKIPQNLMDIGVLDKLTPLIKHPKPEVRKSVYLALSNIAAGTKKQKYILLDHEIAELSLLGLEDCDSNVRFECSIMIKNLMHETTHNFKLKLIPINIFKYLRISLDSKNSVDFLLNILDISNHILAAGEIEAEKLHDACNQVAHLYEDSGCLDELERVIGDSKDNDLFEYGQQIYQDYFGNLENIIENLPVQTPSIFEFS